MLDPSQSPFAKACQTYPHLYAFMRLHTMRPLIAQRLREYWMTACRLAMCGDREVEYFRKRLALTKERYIQVTIQLHELLVEIAMLDAKDKIIQGQCLRLIHAPFPVVESPPADVDGESVAIWFDAMVIEIDDRIEKEHLRLIEGLIATMRGK